MNFKDRSCLVIDNGVFVGLAETLTRSFGKVGYFSPWETAFSDGHELLIGYGLEGIDRIKYVEQVLNDYDLIVFPDCHDPWFQKSLRDQGHRVWGSSLGCELELSRWKTHELLENAGVPVPEAYKIVGVPGLREFFKKHTDEDGWYVKVIGLRGLGETWHASDYDEAKPMLDDLEAKHGGVALMVEFVVEHAITDCVEDGYDGFSVVGEFPKESFVGIEKKNKAYFGRLTPYAKLPDHIRKVNEAVAPAMNKLGYANFFSTELRSGIPIDLTCFSDDTEILTGTGWKLFKDLTDKDSVCTLNPDTREIEFHVPQYHFGYFYGNDMIQITNRKKTIECLVTPNHSVWRTHQKDKRRLWAECADSISSNGFIPRSGIWNGQEQKWFELPEYQNSWTSGRKMRNHRKQIDPAIQIDMDLWLQFLGFYLSEGSLGCHKHQVSVSQQKHRGAFRKVLKQLPFHLTEGRHGFQLSSVQLATYCSQFGRSADKFVPQFVKQLSARQILIFLNAYGLGDGCFQENGRRTFTTVSRILADDLQELILKCGDVANIKTKCVSGTIMQVGDKQYTRNHDCLYVEWCRQRDFWFETGKRKDQFISWVPYWGMVYDVHVQNHILYVRRNGKPFWSGNCRHASPAGEVIVEAMVNLPDVLWNGAEGRLVEPEWSHPYGAQIVFSSDWGMTKWEEVRFPEEIRSHVKLYNHCRLNGVDWVIPDGHDNKVGSVVALGNTPQEAIKAVNAMAEQVHGFDLEYDDSALDKAVDEIEALDKNGKA